MEANVVVMETGVVGGEGEVGGGDETEASPSFHHHTCVHHLIDGQGRPDEGESACCCCLLAVTQLPGGA